MQYTQEYPMPEPRRSPLKIALLIGIIVLLVLVSLIFIIRPAPERIIIPREIASVSLLASFVDENFNYGLQPNGEYLQGDGIYLYIEAVNFNQTSDFKVDVTQDLEIKDSDENTVFERKDFGVLKQTYTGKIDLVRFRNIVPTIGWKAGKYTARITIHDNIAGKSTANILHLSVMEKSKEIVEKTIDLSSVVSSNLADTRLVKQQTVFDPNGNIIPELSFNQTLTGSLFGINLSDILISARIPERFDAGNYTVEIKYINLENGKSVSARETINVVKQLSISEFIFAKSIDDNYIYEIQPNSRYKAGDDVYIYLRLVDFAQPFANGKYNVNLTEKFEIINSKNAVILSKDNYLLINAANDIKKDSYGIKNGFKTDELAPGTYTVRITMTDINNKQEAVREEVFELQ